MFSSINSIHTHRLDRQVLCCITVILLDYSSILVNEKNGGKNLRGKKKKMAVRTKSVIFKFHLKPGIQKLLSYLADVYLVRYMYIYGRTGQRPKTGT